MADENTIVIHYDANLKELNKQKRVVENALSDIEANPDISSEFKTELNNVKKLIDQNTKDLQKAISRIENIEVDNKQFRKFADNTEKIFQDLMSNINLLSEKMKTLENGIDLSGTVSQFKKMSETVNATNTAISEVIKTTGKNMSVQLSSGTDLAQLSKELSSAIASYQKFFNADDPFEEYDNKSAKERVDLLKQMDSEFKQLYPDADKLANELKSLDPNSEEFVVANARLMIYKNQLQELADRIATVKDVMEGLGESIPKGIGTQEFTSETENFLDKIEEDSSKASESLKELIQSTKQVAQVVSREELSGKDGAVKIAAKISTDDDTLYKQLVRKLNAVQQKLNARGAIQVPVKLVVEGTPYSESKKDDITKSTAKSVRESAEGVVADVDSITNRTVKTVLKNVKTQFTQAIKDIRDDIIEVFSSPNSVIPITAEVTKESLDNIQKSLNADELTGAINLTDGLTEAETKIDNISEKAKTLVDMINKKTDVFPDYSSVFAQITSILDEFKGIKQIIEKINNGEFKLGGDTNAIKLNVDDLKEAFDKLSDSIESVKSQLKEPVTVDSLWFDIGERFRNLADETGKIDFRKKRAELKQFVDEYQRYVQLGGTNTLDMLTNNQKTLSKLQEKSSVNVIKNQNVEEVKTQLDGLITKLSDVNDSVLRVKTSISELKIEASQIETFEKLATALEGIEKALNTSTSISDNPLFGNGRKLNSVATFLERIDKLERTTEVFKGLKVTSKQLQGLENLPDVLKAISEKLQDIENLPHSDFLSSLSEISKNAEALKSLSKILTTSEKKVKEVIEKTQNVSIPKESINYVNSLSKALDKLNEKANIEKFPSSYAGKLESLKNTISEFNDIKNKDSSLLTEEDINKVKELISKMKDINYEIKTSKQLATGTQISNAIKKINQFLTNSTKLTKAERLQLEDLITRLRKPDLDKGEFNDIMEVFNGISNNAIKAGRATSNFFDAVKNKLKYGWAEAFARFFSFYDIIRYIREVSSTVTELNSNLIELAKVSDTSIGELYRDFKDFKDIAEETGGTINDIIKSTADWARNGYNLPESKELARLSSIFQNIGDGLTESQANEYLVSTLKGFNLEAEQAIEIMDKINNVSNNAASSVSNIGEALERSSSAFGAANTTLSQAIALLTTSNEVLQNPETVGKNF